MLARPTAFAAALSAALASAGSVGAAPTPAELRSAYEQLLAARYATTATPIPAGGIELAIDSARFRLESGELRAMEPVLGGRITGVVFRGRGRLTLDLPDSRELDHFRRSSERPEAERLDTEFTALVLRDAGGLAERVAAAAGTRPGGPYAPDRLARDRQEVWLERRLVDADAWVTRALAGDAIEWALAEVETPELGWLAVEFDPQRDEELQVAKWRPDELATELWISLDRLSQRGADGRPASAHVPRIDLLHASIEVDLREVSKQRASSSASDVQPRRARFEVDLRFRPLHPDDRTVALELDPWTELAAVRDEGGRELEVLRDRVGVRSTILIDDLWDNTLIVLLPEPLGASPRTLRFVYEGDILNYVGGRSWYPGEDEAIRDQHTATLAITALPKHDLRAMGELVESRDEAGSRFRKYEVRTPVRAATFVYADRYFQGRLETPNQPTVVIFSALGNTGKVAKSVAEDVAGAWRFFAERFGPGPPAPELTVTSIESAHGQAFEGFLHLANETFEIESSGPSELFRAHEVAHQWWGHQVGWTSYRDQWLSEGLAQFSAMLFVESAVDGGADLYREMVGTFAAAARGESKVGRFQRRFSAPLNPKQWRRVGPIALGYRASTADVRSGYPIQTYYRGALVFHMLRELFRAQGAGDAELFALLAELAQRNRGREVSTADLEALLTERAPGDWRWFFRQWVEQTGVPTWRWSWSAGRTAEGAPAVVVEVEQEGVAAGFRSPVPIRIESAGTADRTVWVTIDEPRERFTLPVERAAKRVVLNPDLAILARMEKR